MIAWPALVCLLANSPNQAGQQYMSHGKLLAMQTGIARMRPKEKKIMMQGRLHMSAAQIKALMEEQQKKMSPEQLKSLGMAYSNMDATGLSTQAVEKDYMTPEQLIELVDEEARMPPDSLSKMGAGELVRMEHAAEMQKQKL